MSFVVLDIFDKIFGKMFKSVSSAAEAKAKRETVGKAQAKMAGAQQKMQQKALRGMDNVGPGMGKGGDGDSGVDSRAPAPVSGGYQPQPWEQPEAPPQAGGAAIPVGAPQMGQQGPTCPNGHPIDPSWDVCP